MEIELICSCCGSPQPAPNAGCIGCGASACFFIEAPIDEETLDAYLSGTASKEIVDRIENDPLFLEWLKTEKEQRPLTIQQEKDAASVRKVIARIEAQLQKK